jgi:hypothetical protein
MTITIKKHASFLITSVLLILVLSACGQGTKDVTVSEDNTNKETNTDENTDQTEKEEKEAKLGSRSNPVPLQKTATIDDEIYDDSGEAYKIKFDLTILEVKRGEEAFQQLKSMNEYNEAAPEGYEWVLAKTKVKFLESETQDLSFHIDGVMNFEMVSESGDIYSGDVYATAEPEFSFEMYVGNEKEGYITGLVKTGGKGHLRYNDMLGGHVFFNLQ